MYQSLSTRGLPSKESHQVHQRLIADYDAMLEKEPKDPSLLYLRGRLEGHGQKSAPYFERALAADPNHAYALYATSRTRLLGGDFETALELLTKAIAIRPKDPAFQISQSTYRFAAGDLQTLEKSAREDLTRTPLSTQAMETILKFLVVSNRVDEADREYMAFKTRFQQIVPGRFHSNLDTLKYMLESIKGDFAKLQIALGNSIDPNAKPFEFAAKLELGQLAEAPETLANDGGYWTLCRELVARRLADEAQVTASRETALMMLDKANDSDWAVADVLRRSKAATWDEIADLSCDANHKAVVLVVLAHERPDLKAQLLDLAEKLNFDLEFPHYLIKREIEELRQK
jgi:tetratricopeptide (TPR) repeat protein